MTALLVAALGLVSARRLRTGRKQSHGRRFHEPGGVGRGSHGVAAGRRGAGLP
jgi:hypothetical protein